MSLPQLPNLPDLDSEKQSPPKKKALKSKETKKSGTKKKKEKTETKKKSIIPKTEYDSEGKPILMIPDLNDSELNDEIDRFFG